MDRMPELSKRMEAVAAMVPPQSFTVADVGCDHAYVSIALVKRKLCRRVIAMDVRSGPLRIAEGNVISCGETERIELRQSDGLGGLSPGEADAVILAGMGGLLVIRILTEGREILEAEKPPVLILQPQSDIREVRIFLYENAYHIVREQMVLEDGKYYTVMRAERKEEAKIRTTAPGYTHLYEETGKTVDAFMSGRLAGKRGEEALCDKGESPAWEESPYSEAEYQYGRCGLNGRDPVLAAYLEWERNVLTGILQKLDRQEKMAGGLPPRAAERKKVLEGQLKLNREALACFQKHRGGVVG